MKASEGHMGRVFVLRLEDGDPVPACIERFAADKGNAGGKPVLHMHAALGRSGQTMTGCLRPGVNTWLVGEVVMCEVIGPRAARVPHKESGAELLQVTPP